MVQNKLLFFLLVILSFGSIAQSRFFTDSIFSSNLNEYRKITVYLPNEYDKESTVYPVIYTTDGQIITDSYLKNMDSLIENKLVKPFVLIGSHSNEQPIGGTEYRNLDYKRMTYNPEFPLTIRFDQHMKFFTEELIRYAESSYRVSKKPQERSFYGVSNGADFGVSLAQDYPDFLKNFLLFSVFNGTEKPFEWTREDGLYFYLGYGLKELDHVQKEAVRMEKYFVENGISQTLITWLGGHERKEWELAFFKGLVKLNGTLK
nr:alpha/beta hydrolase-fold protein [uncultured Fluviicola sp.]